MPLQPWMKLISVDEWTDQGLLSRKEARERLAAEIDAESAELARLLRAGPGPHAQTELDARTRRLLALKAAHADLSRTGR